MMEIKNVSIVLATFNGEKYIREQLDSILSQTVLPNEIIICDDNSNDNTVNIVQQYLNTGFIKLIVNDKRLGVVANFKKATTFVKTGSWILFSDQDDIWLPDKIKVLTNEMAALDDGETPSLIYSDLAVINNEGNIVFGSFWKNQKFFPGKTNLKRLLFGNIVTGCSMIINYPMATLFLNMDDAPYLHDEWLSLIAYTFGNVKYLNERLTYYRQHETNVTFRGNSKLMNLYNRLKKYYRHLFGIDNFLSHQFELARGFSSCYHNRISTNQMDIFKSFIEHANDSYLSKKLYKFLIFVKS